MKHILQIAFVLMLPCHTSLCMAASPRVALMSSGDQKASAIVDLMEAELFQRDDVVLLDRSNVETMLREHEVALSGDMAATAALRVGGLLACDIFAEVHVVARTETMPETVFVTAFDAVTGVRLCDLVLAEQPTSESTVASGMFVLQNALKKWHLIQNGKTAKTISLLSARNVNLPLAHKRLPTLINRLLERRLLHASQVTVLERKMLDQVNLEAILTEDRRDSLLASMVMIEIDITANDSNAVVRAFLSNARGKTLGSITVQVDLAKPDEIVEALATGIMEKLSVDNLPGTSANKQAEASRFEREFHRLNLRNRHEDALIAMECAIALSPNDLGKQEALCLALEALAMTRAQNKQYQRVLELVAREWIFLEKWVDLQYRPRSRLVPETMLRFLLSHIDEMDAETAAGVRALRPVARDWFGWIYGKPQSRFHYCMNVDLWAESADEWFDGLVAGGKEWPYQLSWSGTDIFREKRTRHAYGISGGLSVQAIYSLDMLSQAAKHRLMQCYETQAVQGDPFGRLCAIMLPRFCPEAFADSDQLVREQFLLFVDEVIASDNPALMSYFIYAYTGLQLPPDLVLPALKRLEREAERRKLVVPLLVMQLEDMDKEAERGTRIRQACRRLMNSGYALSPRTYQSTTGQLQGQASIPVPVGLEKTIAWMKAEYARRGGNPMDLEGSVSGHRDVPQVSWETMTKIYPISEGRSFSWIASAERSGDSVYLWVIHNVDMHWDPLPKRLGDARSELLRIDLNSGDISPLSSVDSVPEPRGNMGFNTVFDGMSIGESAVYCPNKTGLFLFPLDGRPGKVLKSGGELPKAGVTSAIEVDGHIYIGCAAPANEENRRPTDGFLLRCDLDGKNMVVLAASGRRETSSALDNCAPYRPEGFFYDRPRHRLVFLVDGIPAGKNRGLWSMELDSGVFSKLPKPRAQWYDGLRTYKDGTCLINVNSKNVLKWDPETNGVRHFIGNGSAYGGEPKYYQKHYAMLGALAELDGVLYLSGLVEGSYPPILKYATEGVRWEESHRLKPFDKKAPCLLREWNGKLIAVTYTDVWLLEPDTGGDAP